MNKQLMKIHISEVFKKMCEESGLSNVSVTDLCKKCMINRGTFYYHFVDINSVIAWIFHQNITLPAIDYIDGNFKGITNYVLSKFYEDKKYMVQVFGSDNPETIKLFKDESEQIWNHVYDVLVEQTPQLSEEDKQVLKLVITYFSNAHWFATLNWIKEGMKYTPEQFAQALHTASSNGLEGTLKKLLLINNMHS